jgi:hypothetical protein
LSYGRRSRVFGSLLLALTTTLPTVLLSSCGGSTPAVGVALAVVAVTMRRHRLHAWLHAFAGARDEVRWVSQTLLPSLANELSAAAMLQGWQPASARVMVVEDNLARLERSAPDVRRGASARALRNVLASSRVRVNELLASPDLAAVRVGLTSTAAALADAVRRTASDRSPGAHVG